VSVRCLPTRIPAEIVADVTALQLGEVLFARALSFPEGVLPAEDGGLAVARVASPQQKVEEAAAAVVPVEGEVPAEPEVIGRKRAEEEEGEGEGEGAGDGGKAKPEGAKAKAEGGKAKPEGGKAKEKA